MSGPLRSRVPAAVAALALLAVAGCGSTVRDEIEGGTALGGSQTDTLAEDGLSAPAGSTGGAAAPDGSGAQPLEGPAGGVAGGTSGGGSTGGSDSAGGSGTAGGGSGTADGGTTGAGGGTTGGGAASGSSLGPGVTAKEIKLGIPYCNDCAAGNAAIGAGGDDPGDTRRYYQAALDVVNSRGGVLGRKLVPVWHELSVSDNIDASQQAACERFTKDTQVAAINMRGEIIASCAKKAGVMVMGSGGTKLVFDRYPNLFSPAGIRLEGLYGMTVNAMVKAGWHKPVAPWPTGKIGLITWQTNEYEYAMKEGYLKAMRANGLKAEDVRYIAVPQNANSIADASAAISNAVLAFRQKGIDHVFIGDGPAGIFTGVGLTLLFLQNAQSQSYFPRYGFNSNNGPDFPNHPKEQLAGMIAIDSYDEAKSKDEGIALNPARERCFDIMRKKGLPVGDSQTQMFALNGCEAVFFAEAVLKRAGGSSLDRVIPGAHSLGTSYRSPFTYGTRIRPGQQDGVYLFRNLRFESGCSCLKYTSKPYEP